MTTIEIAEITFRNMYNGILNREYSIRDFQLWVVAQSNISYDEGFEDIALTYVEAPSADIEPKALKRACTVVFFWTPRLPLRGYRIDDLARLHPLLLLLGEEDQTPDLLLTLPEAAAEIGKA